MLTFKPKIQYRRPIDLIPYEKNPKIHFDDQINKIAQQISNFGFDQPIVITADNIIIKGHGRRDAAIKLGMTEVPVIITTLDEYQALASRIGDNKVGESSWDNDLLKFEFNTLDRQALDIALLTGFDSTEIQVIQNGWEPSLNELKGINETSESMSAIIKVKCPPEIKAEVKELLMSALQAASMHTCEVV